MTAPDVRIAEIVAEGRRLETGCGYEDVVDLAMARGAFYRQHGPALLAVAEAAVEWEAADEARYSYCTIEDRKRVDDRWMAARAALRAAVRGEEKTS